MKLYKIYILLFIFINMSFASQLKVGVIYDEYNMNLTQKIIQESNKLFSLEDNLSFKKYNLKDNRGFENIYLKLQKDANIDLILVLLKDSFSSIVKPKTFYKKSIFVGSFDSYDKNIDHDKNLAIIDFSSYTQDIKFIQENFPDYKIISLRSTQIDHFLNSNRDTNVFVYIKSLYKVKEKTREKFFEYLIENKIKSFLSYQVEELNHKALFSKTKSDLGKVARASALQLYQIASEEKVDSYTKVYLKNKIILNNKIANKIQFFPTFNLLSKVIQQDNSIIKSRKLTLIQSLQLALKNSYDYKITTNQLALIDQDIQNAKASFYPDIYLQGSFTQIDSDRAKYSNGTASQKLISSGIGLSQLLYSNKALKNIDIQNYLFSSKQNETETVKQLILYKVVLTYLNVLNLQKSYEIVKSKANFIQENLLLAKNRFDVGISDKSDIYRWQSELANVNIDLVKVKKDFNSLKIELSNLLQIPNKQNITLEHYDLNNELFKLFEKTPADLVFKPKELEKLVNFLANNIINNHPLIKTYEELLSAKKEELRMNKDDLYSPIISLNANINETLKRDGEGADFNRPWDDTQYQVGLNIKVPLYESGKKQIDIEKNKIELLNLQHRLKDEKSKIKKEIFQAIQNVSSSYNSIKFSKAAYKSAKKNYNLIQDKYSKGEANIITLLDAQNSMIIADLVRNSSVFIYLRDISSVFYIIGYIEILSDINKKQEIQNRLKEVIK